MEDNPVWKVKVLSIREEYLILEATTSYEAEERARGFPGVTQILSIEGYEMGKLKNIVISTKHEITPYVRWYEILDEEHGETKTVDFLPYDAPDLSKILPGKYRIIEGHGARLGKSEMLEPTGWQVFETYTEAVDYLNSVYGESDGN